MLHTSPCPGKPRKRLPVASVIFVAAAWLAPAACGGEDPLLDPPAQGKGVQYVLNTELGPGVEAEQCKYVQAPAEGLWVNRDEVRYTSGSHHVLLFETSHTSIPTEPGAIFDCTEGVMQDGKITRLIGGSQNSVGDSMLKFPADVAIPVAPNAVLLMNAHYINSTDQVLRPEVRINLHTIPEGQVREQGDVLFLYNLLIKVAAQSESRARMRCPVYKDITVYNVQSHMHARGIGYEAKVAGEAQPFYTNDLWAEVPVKQFEAGLAIRAGSQLDYHCDYRNPENRDVYQGPRSTDEMCMLIGSYSPADARTAHCLNPTGTFVGSEWVGNGTATCDATRRCVEAAMFATDPSREMTTCMLNADPSLSKEASQVALCLVAKAANPAVDCTAPTTACMSR